jgi:hypothetical protein
LDTATPNVVRTAGFNLDDGREYYLEGGARWAAYLYEGIARKPA